MTFLFRKESVSESDFIIEFIKYVGHYNTLQEYEMSTGRGRDNNTLQYTIVYFSIHKCVKM